MICVFVFEAHRRSQIARSMSGHLTERMQHHYSTVNGVEQRAGIAKVIDLATRQREVA